MTQVAERGVEVEGDHAREIPGNLKENIRKERRGGCKGCEKVRPRNKLMRRVIITKNKIKNNTP